MSLRKIQPLPPQDYLNLLFSYNSEIGVLRWVKNFNFEELLKRYNWSIRRCKVSQTKLSGEIAGHTFKSSSGAMSIQLRLDTKSYYVHRVIWKLVYGEDPEIVDHINGNSLDNRIINLRSVTNLENSRNSKKSRNNTSGITGVSYSKNTSKYEAYIWDNFLKINLGLFTDKEEARIAREKAECDLHYHKNHGRNN